MAFIKEKKIYIIEDGYEISFNTIENHEFNKMENNDKEEFIKLMDITKNKPQLAIKDLIKLKSKYPNIYIIYNYLYNAYIMTDSKEKAHRIAEESYKKFPENIYSKITYAYKFLNDNNLEKVREIFDNKFKLKELYPDKTSFHISELAALVDFCINYYIKIEKIEMAKENFYLLKEIAPSHRLIIVLTRRLSQWL